MAGAAEVLSLLEEILDSGKTPEEVCRDRPDLLPEVRRRWVEFRRLDAEVEAFLPEPGSTQVDLAGADRPSSLPRIPGYEVEAMLGRGGMGVVYKTRHLGLNRTVALKTLLAGSHAGGIERARFQREARAVAALRHSNIVQVYDVGEHDGQPYFTMEFVEGGNLAQWSKGRPQKAREAAALLATLARAMQAAHVVGIVHRDLKPANVLLTADASPKVTDFGLARRMTGEMGLTRTDAAIGTPSYMAPEQARGKAENVGPAADIYSLGAILYELLTGRPPFRAETALETVSQLLWEEPARPSRLNGKVPRDLETICLTCLRKDPRLRYATSAALADDLERYLNGEAIAARPEGRAAKLMRKVRRRPALSAAIALAMISTMALAGGGLWLLSDRAATVRTAQDDLHEMVRHLQASSWSAATAARDRAIGRLGDRDAAQLRPIIAQGARDLELAAHLDEIRLNGSAMINGEVQFAASDIVFADAFRKAGLGTPDDSAEAVAQRVANSNIRSALLVALDHWSACAKDARRKEWALQVARLADPDPAGWRLRARDLRLRENQESLAALVATVPVDDPSVSLLLSLEASWVYGGADKITFLKRIQQAHPNDLWANHRLGFVLVQLNKPNEAVGYFQAALAVRPDSGLLRNNLASVLAAVGRYEEAFEQYGHAVELDPSAGEIHANRARTLARMGKVDAAADLLRNALRANPRSAPIATALGECLEFQNKFDEAFVHYTEGAEFAPTRLGSQQGLRNLLLRRGRTAEAQIAWKRALAADPHDHDAWYGYAEFALFLGMEDEYRRARKALLQNFGATEDPAQAERTARACLLLHASGDEMHAAIALIERALAGSRSRNSRLNPHFLFARGLAEYRQGRLDQAIATMQGDAARVLGPAPRLVLAMAQHRSGRAAESRKTLARAVASHDWRADQARDQDEWIFHVLRREAERMILPNLAAFVAGTYQPQDNDERLALVGDCQFTNRTVAQARLYTEAFSSAPELAEDTKTWSRWRAARVAALAGCGIGADAKTLAEADRKHWRKQARQWLRAELAKWRETHADAEVRDGAKNWLSQWSSESDLAGLREPAKLAKFDVEERAECLALWKDVDDTIKRHASAR